jgi:hypothetical protein
MRRCPKCDSILLKDEWDQEKQALIVTCRGCGYVYQRQENKDKEPERDLTPLGKACVLAIVAAILLLGVGAFALVVKFVWWCLT